MCSVPMDSRMVFGWMPWSSSSCSLHSLCVVEAGWMTSDLTSATFASSEKIFSRSMNACAVRASPLMSKVKMDPPPFG